MKSKYNINYFLKSGSRCPVSGLPVYQAPDWQTGNLEAPYRVRFLKIGDRILFSDPSGYASPEDTRKSLVLNEVVEREILASTESYVQIENFSNLSGFSLEARLVYIKYFEKRTNIRGLIFYGVSLPTSLSIRLAAKMYMAQFPVKVVNTYAEAILLAERIQEHKPGQGSRPQESIVSISHPINQEDSPRLCPITGYGIITHKEWQSMDLGDGAYVSCDLIGSQIFHFQVASSKSLHTSQVERLVDCRRQVRKSLTGTQQPIVELFDFTKCIGLSFSMVRKFLKLMEDSRSNPPINLIYTSSSLIRGLVFKAARLIGRPSFTVQTQFNYFSGLAAAMEVLKPHRQPRVITNEGWSIQSPSYQARYEIIDGHIVHCVSSGYFEPEHVELSIQMQKKLYSLLDPKRDDYYMVAGIEAVTGSPFRARQKYIQAQNEFYEEHPFKTFFFYGLTTFSRAAVSLGRPFIGFDFVLARDLHEVLGAIDQDRLPEDTPTIEPDKSIYHPSPYPMQSPDYVVDILRYIGNINWDADETTRQQVFFPPNHPFRPVFDAIDLIKTDIDAMIENRVQTEKAKNELEIKLIQAQKMEALGLLAGGVAHDLNNVLSGIVTYPDFLLQDLEKDNPFYEGLTLIKLAGEKAAAIVQDLLTMARRGLNLTQVVNINDIVVEFLQSSDRTRLTRDYPNLNITLDLTPDLPNIKGSPVHLAKSLMNLVNNAAESLSNSDTNKIEIRTEFIRGHTTPANRLDIPDGEYVMLRVSDTGVGILKENIPRIFEPFYTKKILGRSGTGLGMTVVWGTVQDHHGYIDVQSHEKKGTTISIYIPVTYEQPTQPETTDDLLDYQAQGESVLVIDDDPVQREIASSLLGYLGYQVTTIPSGEEAIEYLQDYKVDIIVLDMIMDPGMDGLETYIQIKKLLPNQKVVIASGYSETERVLQAQALGAGPLVKKPYNIDLIARVLKQELHPESD